MNEIMRDFSQASRDELKALVKQIDDEQWSGFTDCLGDLGTGFLSWFGYTDIKRHLNKIEKYHKKVLDKNDTTAADIDRIFDLAIEVDALYASKFAACLLKFIEYRKMINVLADTIDPSKNSFSASTMENSLATAYSAFEKSNAAYSKLLVEDLTEEKMEDMPQEEIQKLLSALSSVYLPIIPDVTVGKEYEIRLSPSLVYYYSVESTLDGNLDVGIDAKIEEGKLKLESLSTEVGDKFKSGGEMDSDGNVELSAGTDNANISLSTSGEFKGTASYTVDNTTYEYTYGMDMKTYEMMYEQKVTVEYPEGSVSSTAGIRKSMMPDYSPVPVPAVDPVRVPSYQLDWQAAAETTAEVATVAVVAYAIWWGVKAIAAIPTGGATLLIPV